LLQQVSIQKQKMTELLMPIKFFQYYRLC